MTNEELVWAIQAGDRSLISQLWEQNRGVTVKYIKPYLKFAIANGADSYEDLEQVCFDGMHRAIDKFDDRGAKFTTVYGWFARTCLQKHLGIQHGTMNPEYNSVSLNIPIPGSEDMEYVDAIVDDSLEDTAELISRRDVARIVREEVDNLPQRQRQFIHLMYFNGFTMRDAGIAMGLMQENEARNMHVSALGYLSRNQRLKELVEHDYRKRKARAQRRRGYPRWYYDDVKGSGFSSFRERGESVVERAVLG